MTAALTSVEPPAVQLSDTPRYDSKLLNKLNEIFRSATNILVVSHENPDPDAFGSAGGIGTSLKLLGKEVTFANISAGETDLGFIAGVQQTLSVINETYLPELVIIVDCGDFARVGESFKALIQSYSNATIVNIDHHISNDSFGNLNLIDTAASSTAEILVALLVALDLPFDRDVATALYSGILTDSGSFRYSSVRPYTFLAALECVKRGAKPSDIATALFSSTSLEKVKLHALAMQNMILTCQGKLAFIVVEEKDYMLCNAGSDDCEGLAEKGRNISGVIVSIMIKHDRRLEDGQEKLIWKISMRSKSDQVDLSAVAQSFGGGGHKAAAAFRYRKDLEELKRSLMGTLEPVLKEI